MENGHPEVSGELFFSCGDSPNLQDLVAGIGNIYRAEILFKAGVHPEQPSATVTREAFDRIWSVAQYGD